MQGSTALTRSRKECHENKPTQEILVNQPETNPAISKDSYSGRKFLFSLATPGSYRPRVQSDRSIYWCLLHKTAKYSTISLSQNISINWSLHFSEVLEEVIFMKFLKLFHLFCSHLWGTEGHLSALWYPNVLLNDLWYKNMDVEGPV